LVDDDPFLGSADAPIKMVEFSDFQCGFCARFAQTTLPELVDHYGDLVQFVYRDFPIFGDPSVFAALGAECAADQDPDAFWDYHNRLFENTATQDRRALDPDFLREIAADLDLDVVEWDTCFSAEETVNEIANDYVMAINLGISGTPAFYINDVFVSGAQPIEVFFQIIDAQLIALGIEPPERAN
ncbi:MAG: thioredoxin domain-containing protein, partial [Anaerolineae bacterium]|nr:thioredoxin domain-containing protein [Anaerolineae bacterium]